MTRQRGVERIARFLHLNYPSNCCRVPWGDIDQDCRDGWMAEAAHIYDLAVGGGGSGSDIPNPDNPPIKGA